MRLRIHYNFHLLLSPFYLAQSRRIASFCYFLFHPISFIIAYLCKYSRHTYLLDEIASAMQSVSYKETWNIILKGSLQIASTMVGKHKERWVFTTMCSFVGMTFWARCGLCKRLTVVALTMVCVYFILHARWLHQSLMLMIFCTSYLKTWIRRRHRLSRLEGNGSYKISVKVCLRKIIQMHSIARVISFTPEMELNTSK